MADDVRTCRACGSAGPPKANFCPSCGQRLSPDVEPASYTHSPPRMFGVLSPGAAFVVACALLIGALAGLVTGRPVLAILLLAVSVALFVLAYGAAERDPTSRVTRGAVAVKDGIKSWTILTTGWVTAWSRAGRELIRLRGQLRVLRREREQAKHSLGEAAFKEDESEIASLRIRLREIEQAVSDRERTREQALARARNRVDEERVSIRRTQVVHPDESEPTRGSSEP